MSPAWPTVKLINEPAEAPSVFELRSDGVEASWVICEKSTATGSGVVAPLASVKVKVPVPPVATLPAPLNVMVLLPATVTPGAAVVGTAPHVLAAALVKVQVTGTALPCASYTVELSVTAFAAPPRLFESRLPLTVSVVDILPVIPEPIGTATLVGGTVVLTTPVSGLACQP